MASSQQRDKEETKKESNANEDEDDQWEDLYDESNESMINKLSKLSLANQKKKAPEETCKCSDKTSNEKLSSSAKAANNKSQTTQPVGGAKIDYLKFEPKMPAAPVDSQQHQDESAEENNENEFTKPEYAHMIEIYDFPTSFKNENIMNAFVTGTGIENFSIKWVDDTHCLGVFSNSAEAQKALKVENKTIKARPVSESSEQTRQMAKRKLDYLKPFKARPQTSSLVASRLIGASLGIRVPKEKLDMEKNKLKLAKEKSQKEKDLKDSVWNGES